MEVAKLGDEGQDLQSGDSDGAGDPSGSRSSSGLRTQTVVVSTAVMPMIPSTLVPLRAVAMPQTPVNAWIP